MVVLEAPISSQMSSRHKEKKLCNGFLPSLTIRPQEFLLNSLSRATRLGDIRKARPQQKALFSSDSVPAHSRCVWRYRQHMTHRTSGSAFSRIPVGFQLFYKVCCYFLCLPVGFFVLFYFCFCFFVCFVFVFKATHAINAAWNPELDSEQ